MSQSDNDLIKAAAEGDVKAFEIFLRRHPGVFNHALRLAPNREADICDAYQNACLKFWELIRDGRFNPQIAGPLTLFVGIFRHCLSDALSVPKRQEEMLDHEELVPAPPEPPTPAQEADGKQHDQQLCWHLFRKAGRKLKPRERKALYAVKVKGTSKEDVAKKFHRKVRTIELWIETATRKLRQDEDFEPCTLVGSGAQ